MTRTYCGAFGIYMAVLVSVSHGQAILDGQPNSDFVPLHAWYDVNQSLDVWEGRTDQYDDEFLVDVRDTASGSGPDRGESYPTNLETWAQFDESGGTFWPARVGGFTGSQNGMTSWEVRNGTGWDDGGGWNDLDGVGTAGIGYDNGFTVMFAMSVNDTTSYNSVWDGDPVQANQDVPIINGVTSEWDLGASADPHPDKGTLWIDAERTGSSGPVWVMDRGVEMVAGDVTLGQWQVHTFEFNSDGNGASTHYIDGVVAATGDAGFFELADINIWGSNDGWHRAGNLDFGEGLFYDGALSSGDRSGLESYLYDKWIGATGVDADFNDDGAYDCADIDGLTGEIVAGTNNASYDLTADGVVNVDDQAQWLSDAATANGLGSPYKKGDADLNGAVDVSDFNIWNNNKFTNIAAWCNGDFNADGSADVSDFNELNNNIFTSSDVTAVPEPSSFVLLAVAMLGLGLRRRK